MTRQALAARCATLGAALVLGGPAAADGFSLYSLGEVPTREDCLLRAEEALNAYMDAFGGDQVVTVDWATYAYNLRPGDQDVVIMCPIFRDDGTANAMMVVYGEEDTEENRVATGEEVQRLWGG